jgi:hypothetical protein
MYLITNVTPKLFLVTNYIEAVIRVISISVGITQPSNWQLKRRFLHSSQTFKPLRYIKTGTLIVTEIMVYRTDKVQATFHELFYLLSTFLDCGHSLICLVSKIHERRHICLLRIHFDQCHVSVSLMADANPTISTTRYCTLP